MAALLHHHLVLATGMTGATMMCHPADAAGNKPDEEEEARDNKEPGDPGKKFSSLFFFEFGKQQGACKYR